MSSAEVLRAIKKIDKLGACILAALVALAIGAAYAALHFGWFSSPWQLAAWAVVVVAFLAAGISSQGGQQGIAKSEWADRADIEGAGIIETASDQDGVYLGFFADRDGALTLRYKEGKHLLSFGVPGANKSTGLIVPNLAHLRRSIVVIDPKGELAAITARKRASMGRLIVLNPFRLWVDERPQLESAGWNPLLQLDPASPDFEGDAHCIADALIDKAGASGSGNSKFFENSAENLAAALVMWERHSNGDNASLANLRATVCAPNEYDADKRLRGGFLYTLAQMATCEHVAIANAGKRLAARLLDTKSQSTSAQDVIDTFMAATRFLDDPAVAGDMQKGDKIDFGALHREVTTIYLIPPVSESDAQAKWLRLFVNIALRKLYRNAPTKPALPPVLLMLDEFGNLGWLSQINTALTVARGFRVQLWCFLQNLAQLKGNYKDRWQSFFTGAGAVTSFKTGDMETAEYLAKIYGNKPEYVMTQSARGVSNTPQAIPLIRPEDIGRLPRGETISVIEPCAMPVRGCAPVYVETRYADGLDPNPYHHG